jgi:hypothetical protein
MSGFPGSTWASVSTSPMRTEPYGAMRGSLMAPILPHGSAPVVAGAGSVPFVTVSPRGGTVQGRRPTSRNVGLVGARRGRQSVDTPPVRPITRVNHQSTSPPTQPRLVGERLRGKTCQRYDPLAGVVLSPPWCLGATAPPGPQAPPRQLAATRIAWWWAGLGYEQHRCGAGYPPDHAGLAAAGRDPCLPVGSGPVGFSNADRGP